MLKPFVTTVALLSVVQASSAQQSTPAPRDVPGRSIPFPTTVSPQMQAVIGGPLNPLYNESPKNADEWKAIVQRTAQAAVARLPKLREALGVTVQPTKIGGVNAFIVTPRTIPPRNRNRVLLHFHGGYRVLYPGESGTSEAIMMAGLAGYKVISVDYRMPPDFPFPAALDDGPADVHGPRIAHLRAAR